MTEKCPICGKFMKLIKSDEKVEIEGIGLGYYYWYECKTHGHQVNYEKDECY